MSDVINELAEVLKINFGATTPEKLFTLETTECLGLCDLAPAMTVDEVVYGNLTATSIATIIAQYRKKGASQGDLNGDDRTQNRFEKCGKKQSCQHPGPIWTEAVAKP